MSRLHLSLLIATFWVLTGSPSFDQAQNAAAKECLRLHAQPADQIPWGQHERVYKQWVDVCRQAAAAEPDNLQIRYILARSLMATGQRAEALPLWRDLAIHNDEAEALEIYDMYKSYYRSDVNKPQLVKRAEAEQGLRRAAELGDAYATMMLAVLLDRGDTVKRDNAEAIHWAERAVSNPAKDRRPIDMQVLLARLLAKSDNSTDKVRGIALLEKLAQAGPYNARTELAVAIRPVDPVRARSLFEHGLNSDPGGAIPPLADMLIKGEGGPADPKRAVSLLTGWRGSDVPGVKGALGKLYIEGKLVPRDLKKGIDLFRTWASWDYDARLQLMQLLADNPELTVVRPESIVYDATEAVELGEPGAAAALINLKLSPNEQFRDEAGGCKLVMELEKSRDDVALKYIPECNAIASYERGRAFYERDEFDRAIADYSEAIKLNPKYASAYVGRGSVWYAKKDFDKAIADYDEAIRIDPKHGLAFLDRGFVWEAKKDTDRAIADYDEAIRLYPNYTEAYDRRGHVWQRKGNLDRAIADYSEAMRLDPQHMDATASRGRAYFYKGDFARSAADLSAANKLGDDAYSMLWHFLARGRGGGDGTSELSGNVERLKSKAWPYPVIEFYLGRRSLDSMHEASTKPEEKCEAAFYAGEWQLMSGNKPDARTALQTAADTCPKTFYEYNGAVAELKRIED